MKSDSPKLSCRTRGTERRFRLIFPHTTVDLCPRNGADCFPLMLDHQRSDSGETLLPPPASRLAGHSHDFVELVYVRSGAGLHWHNGHRYSIYAGDSYVILPGEEHTYRSTNQLTITNILFYPEILEPFREQLTAIPGFRRFFTIEPLFRTETSFRHKLHLSLANQEMVIRLLDTMHHELSAQPPGYQVHVTALFLQLVVILSRAFDNTAENGALKRQLEGKDSLVAAAIAYLEQNYADDLKVMDIARSVFISPSRLSHVFKEATGMSLTDYLTRIRIDKACRLLVESDKSITSIAFALGFHDAAYFSRLFTKITGLTPSLYRRQAHPSKKTAA